MVRVTESLSVEETSDLLGLKSETVETRLHRARRLLEAELSDQIGLLFGDVLPFAGKRCQNFTDAVVRRLNLTA